MIHLYTVGVFFLEFFARIGSLFSPKLKAWVRGRNHWKSIPAVEDGVTRVWLHCASVGEFEQARPVIKLLREKDEQIEVVVSFFSPSGFEALSANSDIGIATYMPTDLPWNAKPFLDRINPSLVLFVKYEFWYHMMQAVHELAIPYGLISAYFPKGYGALSWPGKMLGKRIRQFDRIFTQDEASIQVLSESIGYEQAICIGDTRVDQVLAIQSVSFAHPVIDNFVSGDERIVVIGSNWSSDDRLLFDLIQGFPNVKFIVAPHELGEAQQMSWISEFGDKLAVLSQSTPQSLNADVQIVYVDQIGLLSKLYRYADVSYVGGGFGSAVHNTLEAAVYNKPVICGPNNKRFLEIQRLKQLDIVSEIHNLASFKLAMKRALEDEQYRQEVEQASSKFFQNQKGASQVIAFWALDQLSQS